VCAACYGALALLYRAGGVARVPVWHFALSPVQEASFVAFAFLALNFLALYVHHHHAQLRALADRLHDMVREQTAELTRVNAELAAKATSLEREREEHRSFVYTVTHDLKAPVNSLLLGTDDLLRAVAGSLAPEHRVELHRLSALAERTDDMLRDLLDVFRITATPEAVARVDLRHVVDHVVETLRPRIAERGVTVRVGPLPPVAGQREKLWHVLTNLLTNAIAAVPAGAGVIEVVADDLGERVRLRVRDNGVGIPRAYQRAVFDLFRQVPTTNADGARPSGTGIGLAIVKRIVEAHGGTVGVESEPGVGSVFTIELPAAR